jgi:hypothetical protein
MDAGPFATVAMVAHPAAVATPLATVCATYQVFGLQGQKASGCTIAAVAAGFQTMTIRGKKGASTYECG